MAMINIGGTLHNTEVNHVVVNADEIYDVTKQKKQNVINTDTETALNNRYTKNETYSRTELNSMVTTPQVKYVTVSATDQTASVTDVLSSPGKADTVYRVANWDGSTYDTTVYSEYAWNGGNYVFLSKKQYGIDDVPTAGSDNLVKSGGVQKELMDIRSDLFSVEKTGYSIVNNYINNEGKYGSSTSSKHAVIPVQEGERYILENYGQSVDTVRYAFVTDLDVGEDNAISYVSGTTFGTVPHQSKVLLTIPSGCNYLIFNAPSAYPSAIYDYCVVDEEPKEDGEGISKSGGTYKQIYENTHVVEKQITITKGARQYKLLNTGNWNTSAYYYHVLLKVNAGEKYKIIGKTGVIDEYENPVTTFYYAFFTSNETPVSGEAAPLVENTSSMSFAAGQAKTLTIPEGCEYLYFGEGHYSTHQYDYVPFIYKMIGIEDMMRKSEGETKEESNANDLVTRDNLHWEFCGVYHKFGLKFNSSNTIVEGALSSGVQLYYLAYRPCSKDELFKVRAYSGSNSVWFSESAPELNVVCTKLATVANDKYVIIKAPSDGYIMSMNVLGSYSAFFYKVRSVNLDTYAAHKITLENTIKKYGLVVNEGNNYGQLVQASSSNYMTTDYINVTNYTYVAIPIHYTISNSMSLLGSDDRYGAVFYKDGDISNDAPEKVIVSVADVTENYKCGGTGETMYVLYRVPSDAKYLRFTCYYTAFLLGFNRTFADYDDDDLPTIIKINDVEKTKRILNQITYYTRSSYEDAENTFDPKPSNFAQAVVEKVKPLVLLHFSDVHGATPNIKRINEFREYFRGYYDEDGKYHGYIDDTIHTGDLVTDTSADTITKYWTEDCKDILNIIGNHDTRTGSGSSTNWWALDGAAAYTKYFATWIENWNVTQPDVDATEKCYYYKDYPNGIRLIAIDAWPASVSEDNPNKQARLDYITTQLDWFEDTLDDARTNGLHVIVASHFRINCKENGGEVFDSPFSMRNLTTTPDSASANNAFITKVIEFIDAGGTFICWLTGHSHVNGISCRHDIVNPGEDNEKTIKQLNICVGTARKDNSLSGHRNWRLLNDGVAPIDGDDRSQDMFNVLAIDTHYKTITMLRVGADYDKWGRHIETCCIDYKNCSMIY